MILSNSVLKLDQGVYDFVKFRNGLTVDAMAFMPLNAL